MRDSWRGLITVPPGEVLIVTDYDGTIAPIVADPARALPEPKVVERLGALVPLVRRVAVLSGRTEESLRKFLPVAGAVLIGENGIQVLTAEEQVHLRHFLDQARLAVARWPGVVVEAKPASVSVHFRSQPAAAGELESALAELIAGSGLMMVANRMVFDIESRRGSKVRTICNLIRQVTPAAVIYAGDGRDDARVHRFLKTARLETLRIGIASSEMPAGLFRNADLILDGPGEMAAFLGSLVQRWSGPPRGVRRLTEDVAT